MKKYSTAAALVEEAVNTNITKIELEIEPALYKDAPRETNENNKSLKRITRKFPENKMTKQGIWDDFFPERTLEKL